MDELQNWKEKHRQHFKFGSYQTKDLAAFVGVSTRTVQRWLKGTYKPDKGQEARIGEYLKNNP